MMDIVREEYKQENEGDIKSPYVRRQKSDLKIKNDINE